MTVVGHHAGAPEQNRRARCFLHTRATFSNSPGSLIPSGGRPSRIASSVSSLSIHFGWLRRIHHSARDAVLITDCVPPVSSCVFGRSIDEALTVDIIRIAPQAEVRNIASSMIIPGVQVQPREAR